MRSGRGDLMDIFELPYVSEITVNFAKNHFASLLGKGLLMGFGFAFLICVVSYVIFKFYAYLSA